MKNEIVWSEGFGYADVANKIRVTEQTVFRYYSLTKSITGAAMAKLIHAGQLDITKKVPYYLTNLPEQYQNVTIAQLIGHSSGVRHYKRNEWMKVSKSNCLLASEALGSFINDPLVQLPGASFQYSSFGYTILSAVIESLTKSSFSSYIGNALFKPLGITDISLDQSAHAKADQSLYYESWDNATSKAKEASSINNSCKMGGGGLVGTSRSLALFHLSLLNGKVLESNILQLYYTGLNDNNRQPLKYAFGLRIGENEGKPYYYHTGSGLGGNGVILVNPEKKAVVVILGNLENDSMNSVAGKILQLFLQ